MGLEPLTSIQMVISSESVSFPAVSGDMQISLLNIKITGHNRILHSFHILTSLFFSLEIYVLFIFKDIVIYLRERMRERAYEWRRGRRRKSSHRPPTEHGVQHGVGLTAHEIMTWPETKGWTLSQLSHPGAPILERAVRGRGIRYHDPRIMTWAEIKSHMLNWRSPTGAPIYSCLLRLRNHYHH